MNRSQYMPEEPPVSVGIPLFRSRRFLDGLIMNLDALTYGNLEIIISDRHCVDDAVDVLEERYGRDPRFRFIKRRDRIGWVDHYNALLGEFTGRYFVWMPHDDMYPGNYIPDLVSCLEAHPDAVGAFGPYEAVDLAGAPTSYEFVPPPFASEDSWTFLSAMKLLHWRPSKAFRGLFRRQVIARSGLFIRPSYESFAADDGWVFGLALRGRLLYVPHCVSRKRHYPGSTSARVRDGVRHWADHFRVLRSYLKDGCTDPRQRRRGTVHVFLRCARPFCRSALSLVLPDFVKELLKRHLLGIPDKTGVG